MNTIIKMKSLIIFKENLKIIYIVIYIYIYIYIYIFV